MEFNIGQRWISHAETQLGLGIVTEVGARRVKILFPVVSESRIYATDSAPLSRIAYSIGDIISNDQDIAIKVEQIDQKEGLLSYNGSDADGCTHTFHELDLSSFVHFTTPEQRLFSNQIDKNKNFALRVETLKHLHRLQQSTVKGMLGCRTDLLPHQVFIANKIASRHAPRVLLADEVGLGKTIEAGMILHYQVITQQARRILILVPDSLVHQWLVEMLRRFNLSFSVFDHARVSALLDEGMSEPFDSEQFILCPLSLFIEQPEYAAYVQTSGWDTLVVDEAHHLAWSAQQVSPEYQFVEQLAAHCKSLLLITATPEQLGVESHFARLRLLDPARFHDLASYQQEQSRFQQLNLYLQQLQNGASTKDDAHLASLVADIETQDNDQIIAELLDRHGTGRVYFRNTRATVANFPQRHVLAQALTVPSDYPIDRANVYPETDFASQIWLAKDPRVSWLLQLLQALKPTKVLVICHHADTAIQLDNFLNLRAGIRSTSFYEGMTILERDRAAAYFAEGADDDSLYSDMGAQVMICSEIGSEGRNFQFASHLVLFDLAYNPDLIEQRIGRLDRIGQTSDIKIHIPYIKDSAQEVLYHWLHDGLQLFTRSCAAGHEIYTAFSQPLLQLSKQLATSQSIDHTALVQLTSDTHEFTETLTAQLQQGRDRLIELNSFNADQAQHLIAQIEHASQAQNLLEYMERVFDQLGIITEFHSDNSYVIKPGEHMQAELVGLKEDGNTITYSRAKALRREDMEYMSWEHPMVSECLEMIANSEFGNTAVAVISTNALEKGSLLIETWYSINLIADQRLQLQRYLPSTPTRCLLDNKGNDYSQAISYEILNPLCQSLPKKTALAILQKTKALLTELLQKSNTILESQLAPLKQHATEKMQQQLGAELNRLQTLQKTNQTIRDDEIEFLQNSITQSEQFINRASFQLQAIRVIVNN